MGVISAEAQKLFCGDFGARFWGDVSGNVIEIKIDNCSSIEINLFSGEVALVYFDRNSGLFESSDNAYIPLPIKYVHQLQNFIYVYTGNEIGFFAAEEGEKE